MTSIFISDTAVTTDRKMVIIDDRERTKTQYRDKAIMSSDKEFIYTCCGVNNLDITAESLSELSGRVKLSMAIAKQLDIIVKQRDSGNEKNTNYLKPLNALFYQINCQLMETVTAKFKRSGVTKSRLINNANGIHYFINKEYVLIIDGDKNTFEKWLSDKNLVGTMGDFDGKMKLDSDKEDHEHFMWFIGGLFEKMNFVERLFVVDNLSATRVRMIPTKEISYIVNGSGSLHLKTAFKLGADQQRATRFAADTDPLSGIDLTGGICNILYKDLVKVKLPTFASIKPLLTMEEKK